jgi:hypothetical protein
VAHRELHVTRQYLRSVERAAFSDANAIKGPHDSVRQLVLLPGATREIFAPAFLEIRKSKSEAAR